MVLLLPFPWNQAFLVSRPILSRGVRDAGSPPADEVQIQIATQPAGAEVYIGAELVGPSPVEIKRARSTETLSFTIRKSGFKDEKRSVVADHDQTLEIGLSAKRDKVAVRTVRPQGKTAPAQPQPAQQPQHHVTDLRNPFE